MAKQSTIKQQYYQQRKRIQRYYRKYEQQGYERTEKALPSIPKKITEASVRRLKTYTPEKMQKNLISPFYYIEHYVGKPSKGNIITTLYEEKHKTDFSYEYQKLFHTNYPTKFSDKVRPKVYDIKPPKFDYEYYRQIEEEVEYELELKKNFYKYASEDKREWTKADYDYASDEMAMNYKDMSEDELSQMDLMKTDDGYIISTNTGEIIARDMSQEIAKNNEFVNELVDDGYLPADFEWEELNKPEENKQTTPPFSEKAQQGFANKYPDMDDATINMFMANLRKYPKNAYPYIGEIIMGFWSQGGDNDNTKHAIARAIEKTVSEYGWMTREIAYNHEKLQQYGSALIANFDISQSGLESLNSSLEEDEEYFDEE